MADGIPARLNPAEGRKFGFTVGAAFGVLGAIAWWRGHRGLAQVILALAGSLGVAGLLVPTALGPVQRGWMGLAHLISKVTTPIFMGIVYFGVLSPISLLMGLFGKRPLRPRHGTTSYWRARPEGTRRGDLTRQF